MDHGGQQERVVLTGGPGAGKTAVLELVRHRLCRELETAHAASDAAVLLCDRGTVDGVAYWPGPGDLFAAVGARREEELARYQAVIHLRTLDAARMSHPLLSQNPGGTP